MQNIKQRPAHYSQAPQLAEKADEREKPKAGSPISLEELYANAVDKINLPRFEHNSQAVTLGMYENAVGLNPSVVIVTGFVNGFFPNLNYFEETKFSIDQRKP
ncbi:MAG: hypothetical protein IJC51_00010 [Eggerthellaceae bacterium]|nr:hypothetical protein [Eggerthellaceae bacterium]